MTIRQTRRCRLSLHPLEGRDAPLVVSGHPALNGPTAGPQDLGDRGGGVSLLGQDDGLVPEPDPSPDDGLGQSLKLLEGVMFLDDHRSSSWCDPET